MILASFLAVGEMLTLSFFLGPVAVAAVVAAIVAGVGGGIELQLLAFVAASLATLVVVRPVVRRHLRVPAQLRTGTAALIGTTATVLERVDAHGGRVTIDGDVWSARAYDEAIVLEPGARVTVLEIKGATALVSD